VQLDFRFYRRMAYLDRLLTRPVSRAIGRVILPWLGRGKLRHLRDAVEENIRTALRARPEGAGAPPPGSPEQLARRTFSNFGAYIADYFLLPFISRRTIRRWVARHEGIEHLEAAVRASRGVILLTCHLGLWELGAVYLHYGGYAINVVGLEDKAHRGVTEFRDWMRTRQGIGVVNRDGVRLAALTIRHWLEEGKIVALLGDRLVGEKGVEVELFGRSVAFPAGPVRMAQRTGATILPCFVVREGRRYTAAVEPPITITRPDGGPADLRPVVQEIAKRFERRIFNHLDQWYVFFPFWKPPEGFEL